MAKDSAYRLTFLCTGCLSLGIGLYLIIGWPSILIVLGIFGVMTPMMGKLTDIKNGIEDLNL